MSYRNPEAGLVVPLDRADVDTDQIVPKQFLLRNSKEGYEDSLFHGWRYLDNGRPDPDFNLNAPEFAGATILLARSNFGCGSSREHAAWALRDYGFRTILAPSFAGTFCTNAFNNGILPITLAVDEVEDLFARCARGRSYRLSVDIERCALTDLEGGEWFFEIDPFRLSRMRDGHDEIRAVLRYESEIDKFERFSAVPAPTAGQMADR